MKLSKQLCDFFLQKLNSGVFIKKRIENGDWVDLPVDYQTTLKCYCKLDVPRNIFLTIYKSLPPVEDFPAEEKLGWKKFVNEIFPGTTPQFRIECVKIIYCIGVLTN